MSKSAEKIYEDIGARFEASSGEAMGSVLDMFSMAVARADEEIYDEIERNKTPHIWTSLEGDTLDATGLWVNCPRDVGENDASYKYRLMKWTLRNETGNETAIKVRLLNPEHAANIEFISLTNGCGTGTCYVLPRHYTEENISASLQEAHQRMKEVASSGLYVDYIVPEIRSVSFEIYIKASAGDMNAIKEQVTDKIRAYINGIPPKEYLSVGKINKECVQIGQVEYFSILSLIINGKQTGKTKALQEIETKFIFDNISWVVDDENAE